MSKTLAWHFLMATKEHPDGVLRDGRPAPPDGEWLEHGGPCVMCESGLHASKLLIDALFYAPGHIVCRVECDDIKERGDDKLVCRRRRILWRVDAEMLLHEFACRCAEDALAMTADQDPQLARAIEVKRAWMRGEATDGELATAQEAARVPAQYTERYAAQRAVWYAVQRTALLYTVQLTARYAVWGVAQYAAWDVQNCRLTAMVVAAHQKAEQ